jgi:hypothetical protein
MTAASSPLPANADKPGRPEPFGDPVRRAARAADGGCVGRDGVGARRAVQPAAVGDHDGRLHPRRDLLEIRKYLISILEGKRKDDSFFGYIYTLDEGDDPLDRANWLKANPGPGLVEAWEYMHGMARKAAALPSAMVNFLTKDLNVWCGSPDGWLRSRRGTRGGKEVRP